MLEGASIICFAHDWDGDPTSKTHIMRILARRNKILWVNSIGMRRPTVSGRDVRRLVRKLRRALGGCREVEANLFVTNPLVIPLPGVPAADRVNTAILAASLRRLGRRLGFERPILWTFLPNVNRLVGRLSERLVIYHCVDEYAAFSGVDRETLVAMERDLVRKADLVLTSGETLRDERRQHNPNTHFIAHGVDVDHFAKAMDPTVPVPADIAPIPRPIIGFFGLLADWVDIEMFRSLALARPDWSIVLIGKTATDVSSLYAVPNVHFLGQKPYAALPAYCRAFDVGIIPFKTNELTVRANPLKLREYLAAGLPVVATPLPEVARYDGLVRLAAGRDDFLAAIAYSLADRGDARRRERIDEMRSESWNARVDAISRLIVQRLQERSDGGADAPAHGRVVMRG
jgi:glycosyltransferase involved in cell wall biosynthesis